MRLTRFLVAATLAVGLSACSSTDDTDTDSNSSAATSDAFPVTIEHEYGSTTIDAQPERVATVAWSNQDNALALGVVPVGMPKVTYGDDDTDGIHPWVKDKLDELDAETPALFDETDGLDFDAIAASEPDLILAPNSGITKKEYDTLTKITPNVIAYPKGAAWTTSWRDALKITGQALGKSDEAADLTADLEKQISDETAKYPAIDGTTAVMSWIDPTDLSKVGFYTQQDTRAAFLNDLGFTTPPSVAKASEGAESFFVELSAEQADTLDDADVFVGYGDDAALKKAQSDSLIGRIPAIERGSVALLTDNSPLAAAVSPSALSIPWMLPEYTKLLGDAAAKVK